MKKSLFLLIFTTWVSTGFCRGVNGGMSCAVCTVLMGVAIQVAEIKEESIYNATQRLCTYLPQFAQKECLGLLDDMEPIFKDLTNSITPDVFCLVYGTCKVDEGERLCHLFPLPFKEERTHHLVKELKSKVELPPIDVCTFPLIKDICSILNNSYVSLDAVEDADKDGFSSIGTARGSDWRGRDCKDVDPETYPGRRPFIEDVLDDSNCNGIFGKDQITNKAWEEILCRDSDPRGLIYIGDSIGAHFHMPQLWINPIEFTWPSLNASSVILDEIDWPQFGFATGFKNISENILIKGPMDSLYLRLRSRNRCNHRDYQNLSQNGASSYEGITHVNSVMRNQSTDNPAIVIYAMQGNDVCNNFLDTISYMTTPANFRQNVMKVLNVLNTKLPKGSHVLLIGLVEADFIYPQMGERLHPIGILHKNVQYKDMYNWFNCMQIGPCTGWLNSNATLRQITTQRAHELTNVLKEIILKEKFDFFDLHFIENPINLIVREQKISVPDFLEPVDSLHPNQRAQPLLADKVWTYIMSNLPADVLGPVNKQNMKIKKLFGDQGGH